MTEPLSFVKVETMEADKPKLTPKAARKLRRRVVNESLAREAKFWNTPRSAERKGYDKPIDNQAATELFGQLEWDPGFDYKTERSRG